MFVYFDFWHSLQSVFALLWWCLQDCRLKEWKLPESEAIVKSNLSESCVYGRMAMELNKVVIYSINERTWKVAVFGFGKMFNFVVKSLEGAVEGFFCEIIAFKEKLQWFRNLCKSCNFPWNQSNKTNKAKWEIEFLSDVWKFRQKHDHFLRKIQYFFRQINVLTKELISRKFLCVFAFYSTFPNCVCTTTEKYFVKSTIL